MTLLLKDLNWNDCKRRTIRAACYKSDHNTPQVVRKTVYTVADILDNDLYSQIAIEVRRSNDDWVFNLYFEIGEIWMHSRIFVDERYADLKFLERAADYLLSCTDYKGYVEFVINPILESNSCVRKIELLPLVAVKDTALIKKCENHKRRLQIKRAERERLEEEERAERERQEKEMQLADFEAKKEKVIANMKSKNYVGNIDSYGENVIVKMCEDAGINIPLKTKGWMLDRDKFGGFYINKDNNIIVYYDKKNCRCSQTVFRVLEELKMYYSEETEDDKEVMELFGFGGGVKKGE